MAAVAAAGSCPGSGPGPGAARTKKKQKRFVPQRVKLPRAADPLLAVLAWGVTHQITELSQVPLPVMLLPDDFKASSKIKVNNHLFNRCSATCASASAWTTRTTRWAGGHLGGRARARGQLCPRCVPPGVPGTVPPARGGRRAPAAALGRPHAGAEGAEQRGRGGCARAAGALPPVRGAVPWAHAAAAVSGHVPRERGQRGHVPAGDEEPVQPPPARAQEGSLVDREASDKEKGKELPTLKDVDFLNKNEKVFVEEEQQREFMDKLKRDVEFLVQQKLMDYSLLLGIHEVGRGEQEEEEELEEEEPGGGGDEGGLGGPYSTSPEGLGGLLNSYRPLGPGEFDPCVDVYALRGAEGAPRREVYFMGLIDVLTQYDARKKAAHAAKTVKHGAGAEISTVHPEQYAKRFLDFITNIFA
ncbi:phosphatidylinositol 5-phosphate 4-kinase type-2 gamma isoform X1 [Taeniopygia guttata]|uniref:phosphatidylinositol 5-phosphate 4-kinase type-2 gamma isoform X1 n=1 Tax=Taeniopygia guttata TaxID=59729 RepID=UPI003BB9786F